MSSIVLSAADSYVNIGTATAWRETLLDHATSVWIKTTTTMPSCLVSLSNATHEVFSIDLNVKMPEELISSADSASEAADMMGGSFLKSPLACGAPSPLAGGNSSRSPKQRDNNAGEDEPTRGGLRVKIEDVDNNIVVAWSEVPILADNKWHLVEVQVQKRGDVAFRIDGRFVHSRYTRKDQLTEFTSKGLIEKPLYPACDLIGARNHQRHLSDYYCGRIADISVSRGGFDGPRLHWWITDMSSGRTVWDRGDFSHQPPGMHLHCCNSLWDTEDYPTAALYVDGNNGNYAAVRMLNYPTLKAILKPQGSTLSSASTPTPTGRSGGVVMTPLGASSPHASSSSKTPSHSSMNTRSLDKVRNVLSTKISFIVWIQTLSTAPSIVVTIPAADPINMVLNYDGKTPSVSLIVGNDGFVSFSDVCDGSWRQLEWVVDPSSGCSLFIDGQLSTWEPMSLPEMKAGLQRKRKASTAAQGGGAPAFTAFSDTAAPSKERVSFVGETDDVKSGEESNSGSDDEEDSNSDLIDDDEFSVHPKLPDFAIPNNFSAFGESSTEKEDTNSRFTSARANKGISKDGVFILDAVSEQAAKLKTLGGSSENSYDKKPHEKDPLASSDFSSSLYRALSGSTTGTGFSHAEAVERRCAQAKDGATLDLQDELPCVTLGQYFIGKLREFTLSINNFDFYWPLSDGSGRKLLSRLRPAMISAAIGESDDLAQSVASSALKPDIVAELEVIGRFAMWPKTVWPTSCIDFYPGQQAKLGVIDIPHIEKPPMEVSFFARLYTTGDQKRYGHLVEIEKVVIVEAAKDCIIVTVPSHDNSPDAESIKCYVCASLVMEDSKWHLIRVRLENGYGSADGVKLIVDESPVELTPTKVVDPDVEGLNPMGGSIRLSQFDEGCAVGSGSFAAGVSPVISVLRGDQSLASTQGPFPSPAGPPKGFKLSINTVNTLEDSTPRKHTNYTGSELDEDEHANSLSVSNLNPLQTPESKRAVKTFLKRKKTILADSKPKVFQGNLGQQPSLRCEVTLGGFFRGSIQHLSVDGGPRLMVNWPLDEGVGAKLRRVPITMDPTLAKHPNHAPKMTIAATNASAISHTGKVTKEPHDWQPTRLPASALHFNGSSTYVTGHNIGHLFPPSNFSQFSIAMWIKEGNAGTAGKMGCIVTLHDINSPIVEASTGVYTHTRLDTKASPKKRLNAPFTTCFILSDSSERTLALETDVDIYDGLWHKVEWVVEDAVGGEAAIIVDGKTANSVVVSQECPEDFRGDDLVLNVGARDEGDGGIHSHFLGEIRCLKLNAHNDDLVLSWPMDEGAGNVAYDEGNTLVGRIVNPQWVTTTFPPLTPVFSPESGMEFSPVHDMQSEWLKEGITINVTMMSMTKKRGAIMTMLSKTRKALCSFVVNEGGEPGNIAPEVGTHTLTVLHRTKRAVPDPDAPQPDDRSPGSGVRTLRSFRKRDSLTGESLSLQEAPAADSPSDRRSTLPMCSIADAEPTPSLRRAVSRAYVKDLLTNSRSEDKSNNNNKPVPVKSIDAIEEVTFQVHHDELCDGRWHHVRIDLYKDVETCTFSIDNIKIPMLQLSKKFISEAAATASTKKIIRSDPLAWESFIVGRAPDHNSFRGCLKGVSVYTMIGDPLLFVPLAGSTKFTSSIGRDVATSNMKWELAVPPPSCIYLANGGYIVTPPLPGFNFSNFEFTVMLRTPCLTAATILEFGKRGSAYICLMLNQDASGYFSPNTLHGFVQDADGHELHAFCVADITISDNRWHTVRWEVIDAEANDMAFYINGKEQVVRFGECGSPQTFSAVDEGGCIGAVLDALVPRHSLQGLVQKVVLRSNKSRVTYAKWDMNSGYGTVLTDSSGNRNHATAVKPIWRAEIRAPAAFEVPNKATNLFNKASVSVSRWSNNPSDQCIKNPTTKETIMEEWPDDGWHSGAVGPQWVSIDLGTNSTVFQMEITLHKASPSVHEVWCSRSNLNNSRLANRTCPPEDRAIPTMSLVETFNIKSTSSRTLRTNFKAPQFNVRWLRFTTRSSIVPVSVQSIRILGFQGQWKMQRTYSIMRPLIDITYSDQSASLTPPLSHSGRLGELSSRTNDTAILAELDVQTNTTSIPVKSAKDKERELKLLFYTIDVDRTGYISTREFMQVYKQQDVIGTMSEERVYSELRDAGVYGTEMDFEQFRKILAAIDRW